MQHAPVSMADPRAMAPEELLDNAGALRALARRLGADPEDAEDVVQTAYLRALERRPKGRLGTWLWVVVRNEARMLCRRASRRRRSEQLRRTADGAPDPADLACRLAMQRRLVECIEELEPIYRQVVYLRWFEEMPPRAIAALLGVPRKTVETRLRRALANLRSKLDRKYGSREEWLGAVGAYWGNGAATAPFWIGALLMNTKTVFTSSAILAAGLVVFMVARSEPAPPGAAPEPAVGPAMATVASPDDTDIDPESLSRSSVRPDRAPAGTGELLTGAVVDERSNPVGGLPLRFEPEQQGHWADPGPVVTEPDGSFAIGRPAVSGRILADDPAWTTLLAGTTTWDDRPVWVVVAGAARIAGTVVHADGSPVPAVRVVVELPVGFRTRFDFPLANSEDRSWKGLTDDRGFFQLADVPLMEGCRITWTKTDYAPEKRELRRDERELHVVLRPLVAEGGELRGVVVDDRGQPVSGAQVALGREVRRTREDGSFTFLVDPGADRLLAVAEGWMPVVLRREPPGWPAYVELRFARRPMSLSGRVLDEAGMAHGNALVWVEDLTYFGAARAAEHEMQESESGRVWRAVATDDQGRFEIPGLMDREYRVRAIDKRTALMTASGTARAGNDSLVLQFPAGSIHAEVTGHVRDSAGRPVSGVRVLVQREVFRLHSPEYGGRRFIQHASGAGTRSDAEGRFRLEGVPREGIYLTLYGEGVFRKRLTFPDDRVPVRFDILVERECRIRIDVSGSEYAAADGARVLNVSGEPLRMERRVPDLTTVGETTKLVEGRSEVVVVPDSAVEVLLLRGDEELGRLPVRPDPERLVTVRR